MEELSNPVYFSEIIISLLSAEFAHSMESLKTFYETEMLRVNNGSGAGQSMGYSRI